MGVNNNNKKQARVNKSVSAPATDALTDNLSSHAVGIRRRRLVDPQREASWVSVHSTGREAATLGHDATDYNRSYTARSFVPYYAQRMSNAIVINGAQGILNGINKLRRDRLRCTSQA